MLSEAKYLRWLPGRSGCFRYFASLSMTCMGPLLATSDASLSLSMTWLMCWCCSFAYCSVHVVSCHYMMVKVDQ